MQFDLPVVMPRILDPKLQFDEETILKGLQSSKEKFVKDKMAIIDIPEKESAMTVIVKYKYHMLAVLATVALIFIFYKLYKYYFNKSGSEPESNPAQQDLNKSEPEPNPAPQDLSKYISDEYDSDSESESDSEIDLPKFNENVIVTKAMESQQESQVDSQPESQQESQAESQAESQQESQVESQAMFDSQETVMPDSQSDWVPENSQSDYQDIDSFLMSDADSGIDIFNKYK